MPQRVIIIGGGVAGMTAAHELASRGFEVVVYELRNIPGGKARSIRNASAQAAVNGLPGEHGFRFFPGFYKHVPDTMRRIPLANGRTVFDNLTQSTRIEMAREDSAPIISPAQFPRSLEEVKLAAASTWVYVTRLGIRLGDQLYYAALLGRLLASCERRRFGEYENESWWDLSGAQTRGKAYQTYMADGLTRTLVAARAKEMSARTGGYILLQLLEDMMQPGMQVDRVLNAPTNEAWLDPWLDHLRDRGVDYRTCHRVEEIHSSRTQVTGVTVSQITWPQQVATTSFVDTADFYIAAGARRGDAAADQDPAESAGAAARQARQARVPMDERDRLLPQGGRDAGARAHHLHRFFLVAYGDLAASVLAGRRFLTARRRHGPGHLVGGHLGLEHAGRARGGRQGRHGLSGRRDRRGGVGAAEGEPEPQAHGVT